MDHMKEICTSEFNFKVISHVDFADVYCSQKFPEEMSFLHLMQDLLNLVLSPY